MSQLRQTATRSQLALQSYLDGLLQEATEELEVPPVPAIDQAPADEFQAAVLEEQVRDAQRARRCEPLPALAPRPFDVQQARKLPDVLPVAEVVIAEIEPLVEVHLPRSPNAPTPPATVDGRPAWAAEPFECLLFDVAGLTLAVPLVCLGSIYTLAGQELTPLFGQPDWFLGILTCQAGNLKVLDTARWVMPERYRDDLRQGLQYVISVQGYEWGLAVHQVSRSLRLDPSEIKWRSQRGQRPWLAGTVIEHMCALLDVAELAELIASGAAKQMHANHK